MLQFASLLMAWGPSTASIIKQQPLRDNRLTRPLVREIRAVSGNVLGDELEKLLAVSNLPEIVWRLQEEEATDRAAELRALLQHRLEHSAVRDMRDISAGTTGARLVELEDGLRAVFKVTNNAEDLFWREVLLYRFDNLIGTNVVPMTTTRTIAGEEGSLQLFVENSLPATDILAAKLTQLGLGYDFLKNAILNTYQPLSSALTPPISPAVKTLRLLSLEVGPNNPGNYLLPHRGRQIAIDGGRAFSADADQVEESIRHLRKHPQIYQLDSHIVANMETHLAIIEEFFADSRAKEHLHETFTAYKEIVKTDKKDIARLSEEDAALALVTALAAENWDTADRLLDEIRKYHRPILVNSTKNLFTIARRQKNWMLIRWISENDLDHFEWTFDNLHLQLSGLLEYALHTHDYEFAARLSALGIETRPNPNPALRLLHENLLDTIAYELGDLTIDWNGIDWNVIDWEEVRIKLDPTYSVKISTMDGDLGKHLIYALYINDLPAIDRMLRDYDFEHTERGIRILLDLLVEVNNSADWFITHDVILRALIDTERPWSYRLEWQEINRVLSIAIINYVVMLHPDAQEIETREKVLRFLSRIYIKHFSNINFMIKFHEHFDQLLKSSPIFLAPRQQRIKRLRQASYIFLQEMEKRFGKRKIKKKYSNFLDEAINQATEAESG